jgi:hypothetical protein
VKVVGRVAPVTDEAFVVTGAAFPVDRRCRLAPQQDGPAGAGAIAGSTSTGQRTHPVHAGVAGGGGPDEAAQVPGQAAGWGGYVVEEVEVVVQIGDQHRHDCIDAAVVSSHRAANQRAARSWRAWGEPIGGPRVPPSGTALSSQRTQLRLLPHVRCALPSPGHPGADPACWQPLVRAAARANSCVRAAGGSASGIHDLSRTRVIKSAGRPAVL